MVKSDLLHICIKFHEVYEEIGGLNYFTMQEHINVMNSKGKVIWGHMTANNSKKGLWDARIEKISQQIDNGKPAMVFFLDQENKFLYAARFIDSYKRVDIEPGDTRLQYIPSYYHDRVGTKLNNSQSETRCYAYLELKDITLLNIDDVENIFIYYPSDSNSQKRVIDSEGMASIFYVNLERNFEEKIDKLIVDSNNKQVSLVSEPDGNDYKLAKLGEENEKLKMLLGEKELENAMLKELLKKTEIHK